jgi:uncharacterized protein
MRKLFIICLFSCLVPFSLAADIQIDHVPQLIELTGETGERVGGGSWSSDELTGKVHVLFYVDPDEKNLNNEASEALADADFPDEHYQSVAIINMAATWMPKFLISSSLKKKQKEYPDTIYVRDNQKVLVNVWGITDDNSDVLVFNKTGKLIFRKDGLLNADDIKLLLKTIQDHL